MKFYTLFITLLLTVTSSLLLGQDIATLEQTLKETADSREKMILNYQLAEAYLRQDTDKSIDYGKDAHALSTSLNNHGMTAQVSYLLGQAYERDRNKRNAEVWYRTSLSFAKQANDSDLIMKSVTARSKLAVKDRNYRKAYEINQEAFNYFSQKGTSISDLERQYEIQRAELEKQRRGLEGEKARLSNEVRNLSQEKSQLSTINSKLTKDQKRLEVEKQQAEKVITQKEEEIETIEEEKRKVESVSRKKERIINSLTKEMIADSLALVETELDLANVKLAKQNQQYFLYLMGGIASLILLMALSFYGRYRAKKRATKVLEDKNKLIEEERERSDELLLNILPEPIAKELKEKGHAKAQKFNDVTVLFLDFKNFTRISEQLMPEQLVKELDYCFRGFDNIIAKYNDIEKIKTVGDAYICASGLTSNKTIPKNIIKTALEMQTFLKKRIEERKKYSLPYFEARIGLHTGPVVAGVVGVKKFAYDIWGDTVNIAARVESKCEPGRVNISQATYQEIKYHFDCIYRGQVEAKNKGAIDMYYVLQNQTVAV